MGGKSSGWLSDCSLMVDEFKYIDAKTRVGLVADADRLRHFRRYRDDCTSLNIENFLEIASEIYPPSLTLTQENDQPNRASVLDMVAEIQDGRVTTKVYCKTDDFPFNVISFPFLESNIDSKMCYRVFYGQVVRYQRLSSFKVDFEERVGILAGILTARGYHENFLRRQFCRAVDKYTTEFQKWALPLDLANWFYQIVRSR